MVGKVLLDYTVILELMKGNRKVLEIIEDKDPLIHIISIYQILRNADLDENSLELLKEVANSIAILDIDFDTCMLAREIEKTAKENGIQLDSEDCIFLAAAVIMEADIITSREELGEIIKTLKRKGILSEMEILRI